MGMDIRVLIGVFVTLFGIAVGMAGGDIQSQNIMDTLDDADFSSGIPDISILQDLLSSHQSLPANTSINALLTSHEAMTLDVTVPATLTIDVAPESGIQIGDAMFTVRAADESDRASVTFRGFTGTVRTDGNLSLEGQVNGVDMSVMSMNYSQAKQVSAMDQVQSIHLSDVRDQHATFTVAEGNIDTGATDISLSKEQAVLRFFRGDLEIMPDDEAFNYTFEGHIHEGTLGDSQVTIGGT